MLRNKWIQNEKKKDTSLRVSVTGTCRISCDRFSLLPANGMESRGRSNNSHHSSHHYRNAAQISDTPGVSGRCISLGCWKQTHRLTRGAATLWNECAVITWLASVQRFNEFLVNENHTHISRKLHGQVGDFFLGAFQLSLQLADLLWTKKWTAAALLNNSTNISVIIIMQEQKGAQKSCFVNRTRTHKQNLNAITH